MYVLVHHVPGRLRLKRFPLERNKLEAARISALLTPCKGVHRSQVSTLTGSIVIHYDPTLTTVQAILTTLSQPRMIEGTADRLPPLSPARVPALARTPIPARVRSHEILANLSVTLGKMILETAIEKLVERSVFVLVRALV